MDEEQMSNISEFSYNGGSGDYENVKSQLKHKDDFSLFKSKQLNYKEENSHSLIVNK